jgi:ABC-type transport system substrate-binding protein
MAPSESKYWLKTEHYNMIKTYSFDQAKATQLLEAEGWTKTDGKWYKDGAPVKLYMGVWQDHPGQSAAAEAAQAALIDFGIDCVLKKSDSSSFFSNAMIEDSPYDMVLEWTELNMSFSYPTGSFQQFDSVYARYAHLPRYSADYKGENGETSPLANNLKLEFEYLGEGGGTIKFADKISILYSLNENELKDVVGSMVVGLSKLNYGISFYQNVTGSFLNVGMIDGVPLKDYWSQDRNVTYVPEAGTEDFYEVARTNMIFANCVLMTMGIYQPTEAK